jgi:isoquinoline 1-oxidoreductase beta subunit
MEKTNLSRRRFVIGSAAAGGGLAIGLRVPLARGERQAVSAAAAEASEVNVWVAVRPDDTCVIRVARTEMGQGTYTGLAQLVAEELECDWAKVTVEPITPGQNLARKRAWGEMGTGGSRGIRTSEDYVRRGGAAARTLLLQAAANEWNVPVGELTVEKGVIAHAGTGRTTTYGKVAAAASKLTPPDAKSLQLKDPRAWKIAGQPLPRVDTAEKLNGKLVYAIDVRLPGMLNAAIRQCPVFGGRVASFDAAKVRKMPGVKDVVKVDDASVAVVADTWWHAKKALDALPVQWEAGEGATESSAGIDARLREGLEAKDAYRYRSEGDVEAALAAAAKRVEAVYSIPFVAHATMEPMTCTVRYTPERAECWVSTQNAEASLAALAETTGLALAQCEAYRHTAGGGFGRRGGNQDYVKQAASIAKHFPGTPVKLIWSREEDMTHDFYRPIAQCRLRAGLDADGNLVALHARLAGQSINAFVNPA